MSCVGLLVLQRLFEPEVPATRVASSLPELRPRSHSTDSLARGRCPGAALDPLYNGSKPIIASTGSRTIERVVEVEEVATDLTLDGSVDDVNLPALRLVLSDLYQLPPSTITLRLGGGSVVVRVLVAGASGTNLSQISAAISSVDAPTLSAAVSDALGTAVISATVPENSWRNVSQFEEHQCSRGYWCTAALTIEWCVAPTQLPEAPHTTLHNPPLMNVGACLDPVSAATSIRI